MCCVLSFDFVVICHTATDNTCSPSIFWFLQTEQHETADKVVSEFSCRTSDQGVPPSYVPSEGSGGSLLTSPGCGQQMLVPSVSTATRALPCVFLCPSFPLLNRTPVLGAGVHLPSVCVACTHTVQRPCVQVTLAV